MDHTSLGHLLQGNQFLSGGLILGLLGAALATLRGVPAHLWSFARRKLILTVEFQGTDPAFDWLRAWIAQHPYAQETRHLMLHTTEDRSLEEGYSYRKRKPRIYITPAPGLHFLWYKGRLCWLMLSREKMRNDGMLVGYSEELTINSLLGDHSFVRELIDEAYLAANPPHDDVVKIFAPESWGDGWKRIAERKPRRLDSLIFDGDLTQTIQRDLETFLAQKDWYEEMGIPWRRGFLFYGEPGSGKTSLVLAMAGVLHCNIYMINFSGWNAGDDRLTSLLAAVPPGSIVLLEEIDTIYRNAHAQQTKRKKDDEDKGITFGGLLTALDGAATQDGRILFMTTNHREVLDEALIRPGRTDMHIRLGHASHDQMIRMFRRFFPEETPADLEHRVSQTPDKSFSMAALQEHLLRYRNDPAMALTKLPELVVTPEDPPTPVTRRHKAAS